MPGVPVVAPTVTIVIHPTVVLGRTATMGRAVRNPCMVAAAAVGVR
ncbi:MAG TPA: hypothetical protein VMX37_05110 [Acidimicrobiia bacterium]|nr:hypothetical protein [Acidimicrobiia bacterium]